MRIFFLTPGLLPRFIVALIPCATLFLVSCGGNSPWQEIVDKDNYLLERRNKQGELVLHERVVNGKYDGYYRVNNFPPYLVNEEGWYDMGIKVNLWKYWYGNGSLQCEERYAPTASVERIYHTLENRNAILLSSHDYDVDGVLIGVSTNGIGIRVRIIDGNLPYMSHFSTIGFPTNYYVSYDHSTDDINDADDTVAVSDVIESRLLPGGGGRIFRKISWWPKMAGLKEVYEKPLGSPVRWVMFDSHGNVTHRKGNTPDFLKGVPVAIPSLNSNELVFCEMATYKNGETTLERLPENECERIKMW